MGFNEDDRIRRKNVVINDAMDLYEGLKIMGYESKDIIKYADFAYSSCTDTLQKKVYETIKEIAIKLNEST